jgi:uncharacterized membrane protein
VDFIFFLGRMHILVLHIPIGVILLAVIGDWLSGRPRFAGVRQILPLLWGIGAVTAVLSVVSGLMHAQEGGFDASFVGPHRFYAILTMVLSLVTWFLRAKGTEAVEAIGKAAGLVTLIALLLTVYYGSRVTHGGNFLQVRAVAAGPWLAGRSTSRSRPHRPSRTPPAPAAKNASSRTSASVSQRQ